MGTEAPSPRRGAKKAPGGRTSGAGKGFKALLAASAAGALGRARSLRRALQAALRAGVPPSAVDETLLQLVPFAGFGRAINAFMVWAPLRPHPPRERPDRGADGRTLCRRVYGKAFDRLAERMRSLHPSLWEWILRDGYGRVLSRPGLPVRDRELLAVAVLAALRLKPQLESHVRGALRLGATPAQVADALRS